MNLSTRSILYFVCCVVLPNKVSNVHSLRFDVWNTVCRQRPRTSKQHRDGPRRAVIHYDIPSASFHFIGCIYITTLLSFLMSYHSSRDNNGPNRRTLFTAGAVATGIGLLAFAATRYKVCNPNQFLVKTGLGIQGIHVAKQGVIWPFQKYQLIEMNPRSYRIPLQNISAERVPFSLPIVITVAPHDPEKNVELFKNFAKTITTESGDYEHVMSRTVHSIVHGEARILSASLTVDEMFSDRDKFKTMVTEKIQKDLDQFGLSIQNANVEEFADLPGNEYFEQRKQKALANALSQAKVDIALATQLATIGEQERVAATKQRVAQLAAETRAIENQRDQDIEQTTKDLEVAKANFARETELARIEGQMKAQERSLELQKQVEARRVEQEVETLRSKEFVRAKVNAECAVAKATGESASQSTLADAELYVSNQKAEARKRIADAELYAEMKRAEGLRAVYDAEAKGVQQILEACGGSTSLYQYKLAMNANLFPQLAQHNASAIQGLQPKINVWNTGASGTGDDNTFKSIQDIVRMVPPIMDVLNTQTELKLPFTHTATSKSPSAL